MTMLTRVFTGLLVTLALGSTARAEIITYIVDYGTFDGSTFTPIADGMTVDIGTNINWRVTATVTGADADNFGISTAFLDATDSTGDMINPIPIPPDGNGGFGDEFTTPGAYSSIQEGTPSGGSLVEFGVFQNMENGLQAASGADPVPSVLFAIGEYTLSTFGMHTLSLSPGSENIFFTAAGQTSSEGEDFTVVTDDTAVINAVPEPGSMLLASTLLVPGLIAVRRRRRREKLEQAV